MDYTTQTIEIEWIDRFGQMQTEASVTVYFEISHDAGDRESEGYTICDIDRVEWDDTRGIIVDQGEVRLKESVTHLADISELETACIEEWEATR